MKAFTKVVFLTLAACASADSSMRKNIYETSDEPNLESSADSMLDELEVEVSATQNMCPMDVKECPDGSWVSRNAKKECKFDKCKKAPKPTRKPTNTRKPTRRPTRRPTRKPTRRPTSNSRCVDDERPRPVRSGVGRFRFNLMDSNAQCVDSEDRLYEYGQFDKIKEFSDCAEACVNDVSESLLDSFRGFDWNCSSNECRCLYDRGTLSNRTSRRFDRTNRRERGRGSIEGTTDERDMYCAKLAGAELFNTGLKDAYVEEEAILAEARRAVRGYNN